MANTPQTPSGHETLHIGQQLFAALTHNEIAHLLDVLLGTVSPDMVEHVLAQLQPDTRQTVQTLLIPSNAADTTQDLPTPSVSLAKLEQTWSALWQEWDNIVDEAAQEDGTYLVQERPWEEPYFDSTTFVHDLERVAKAMRPLLRTAFEHAFVPATSFIEALLDADAAIRAALPEWMSLDDGYEVNEHVTACLLEWEWLQVQADTADVFLLVQRLREWEEESAYAKLAPDPFLAFFTQLPEEQQQHIFSGLTTHKDTPLWHPVLTNAFSPWHALYMRSVERYAPEQYMDHLRPTISQRWENGLPVIASYVARHDFQENPSCTAYAPRPMKMGRPCGMLGDHVAAQTSGKRWCPEPAGKSDARIFAAPPLVAPTRGARRGDLSSELMRRSACVATEAIRVAGRKPLCACCIRRVLVWMSTKRMSKCAW